jgi:hypothetical protein
MSLMTHTVVAGHCVPKPVGSVTLVFGDVARSPIKRISKKSEILCMNGQSAPGCVQQRHAKEAGWPYSVTHSRLPVRAGQ